jgi:hypothetical protein
MRPITTLIAMALVVASGEACSQDEPGKQPKLPVHISIPARVQLPEHFWTLEIIQPSGEIYRTSFPSKEACEAAIPAKEAEQHGYNGRCVEHKLSDE